MGWRSFLPPFLLEAVPTFGGYRLQALGNQNGFCLLQRLFRQPFPGTATDWRTNSGWSTKT
jgi:hypothetical protein